MSRTMNGLRAASGVGAAMCSGAAMTIAFGLAAPAHAGNIVTFGANANKCGGAVICSYDGTTGYLNNGMGQPFNLSTINQWFQIDAGGLNMLPSQTMPEPNKGAGSFLVTNDTGAPLTSFTLTLDDDFTAKTASVHPCTGAQKGNICNNFAAHGGSGNFTYDTELGGADWDRCTQGTVNGQTCTGKAGGVAADFAPGSASYTWTAEPGKSVPAGGTFTISFSGWNNDGVAFPPSLCDGVSGNLVQNCGFETGDFTDWTADLGSDGYATASRDANSGNYSADLVLTTAGTASLQQNVSVQSGHTYLAGFYVKEDDRALGLAGATVSFNGVCDGSWSTSNLIGYNSWKYYSFETHCTGDVASLIVQMTNNSPYAEEVQFDDFTITPE